jgi:hypothetical protein
MLLKECVRPVVSLRLARGRLASNAEGFSSLLPQNPEVKDSVHFFSVNFPSGGIGTIMEGIQPPMGKKLIFDEKYRVVGVEADRLLLRGVRSGDVLTVVNPEPATPLTQEEYPVGKLIALSDPSAAPLN